MKKRAFALLMATMSVSMIGCGNQAAVSSDNYADLAVEVQ